MIRPKSYASGPFEFRWSLRRILKAVLKGKSWDGDRLDVNDPLHCSGRNTTDFTQSSTFKLLMLKASISLETLAYA